MPASRFGGGRSTEAVGFGATAYGRRIWWVCLASGSVLSALMGSDASYNSCGHGGAVAGGKECSARWLGRLGEAIEHGVRGKRIMASQRID